MAQKETFFECYKTQPSSSLACSSTTPPDRVIRFPPTPPATVGPQAQSIDASDPLLHLLESYRNPLIPVSLGSWVEIPLDEEKFASLRGRIESSVKRFDYDPNHGLLTFRMPSTVHDYFANELAHNVRQRLNDIANKAAETAAFISSVRSGGSANIRLSEGDSVTFKAIIRQPDGQFRHLDAFYPGVVIEVSYSQDGKSLKKLAQDYILHSNGDIKAVIGIDINYKGKESTVSLWCPKYTQPEEGDVEHLELTEVISQEPFRCSDGSRANPEQCLTLKLSDFATDSLSAAYESTPLSIPFSKLFDILREVENMGLKKRSNTARSVEKSRRVTRKRKVSSSSEEQLHSEDEAKFARFEEADAERASRDDEYSEPATKRKA